MINSLKINRTQPPVITNRLFYLFFSYSVLISVALYYLLIPVQDYLEKSAIGFNGWLKQKR
jgi:hypothetical protein